MDISLEDIDRVVERAKVSYKEAKEALEKNNGDVIEAIIYLENQHKTWTENLSDTGEQIISKVKEILRKGNVTKIIVKKDNEIIMNIPVTAGVIGTILGAPVALLGLGAAVISKCTIEITKEDGEVINVNDLIEKENQHTQNPS